MYLPRLSLCTDCPLQEQCQNQGLPTRRSAHSSGNCSKAIVLLGKCPGLREDAQGQVFVGETGRITEQCYVEASGLFRVADCYLTNAVRCKPNRPSASIPQGCLKACRSHLEADIATLARHYKEVVVVAMGSEAIQSVLGRVASFREFEQGCSVQFGGVSCRTFATYLPAMLLPGRDPSKAVAVEDHLDLVEEYCRTGHLRMEVCVESGEVDRKSRIPQEAGLVSLDVETYGASEGYSRQRFFHPRKCMHWDGIAARDLVLTAAAAWRDPRSGDLQHRLYCLTHPHERSQLYADLTGLTTPWILGQNVPFDVMFLRATPGIGPALNRHFNLMDLMVLNFLDSDQRPERSLKNLSPLLRTYDYQEEAVNLRKGERYQSPEDPALWRYNVVDAIATLRNCEILRERLPRKYGEDTPKGSKRCLEWYSGLLWLAITMGENGICYDTRRLHLLHERLERGLDRLCGLSDRLHAGTLHGKGSKKYADALADRAVQELDLGGDPRLELTAQTKRVSTGIENINLFLGVAEPKSPLGVELRTLRKFREWAKVRDTYTRPMLGLHREKASEKQIGRDLNNALVNGFAYPTWYVIPREDGGTQQGRITSKGHAVQTEPPVVQDCQCSRFPGGALIRLDMKQIELRVPVMFSGDPSLLRDFQQGVNPHESLAARLVGHPVGKKSHPKDYLLGKHVNFEISFRGGARGLQELARRLSGIDLPLADCERLLRDTRAIRSAYVHWQDRQIEQAGRKGYLELPVLGISRTFWGGPAAVGQSYIPTVCNFPIQTIAALLTLSAQMAAEDWLRGRGLHALSVTNTYDEGVYDVPQEEVALLIERLPGFYQEPPIYRELLAAGLHPVPLDCDLTVAYYSTRGTTDGGAKPTRSEQRAA